MTDQPASTAPLAAGLPLVRGRCPACCRAALFLGSGGYVTCATRDCPNPCAADQMLHGELQIPRPRGATPAVPCPACRRADQAGLAPTEQHPECAQQQPAHDAGPDVAECAADDRNWDVQKAGE